jgi:transglutaminase-like putative cysteine protease
VGATSGERFEKALEAIRENVGRLEKKHALSGVEGADKGEDDAKERGIIKTKRAEIESADSEFRKEFVATEKKLKDAKLPKEILDRHYKFVKHYEDNLKELKTNLAGIEQGAKSKGYRESIKKAKAHLEKTRTPSKHVPLDPNKLPHRMVKGKERAPRLKKEEFEKEFGPQRTQKTPRTAGLWDADERGLSRIFNSVLFNPGSAIERKPILLASNAPASDMPLQLPRPLGERIEVRGGLNPQLDFSTSPNPLVSLSEPLLLAQTTVDLPTAADLSETPEVQFTPEIQAKAQELGYGPVKIYEWVRNNIEFVPTYGSIQGADMCLQTKQCNAFDAASLLIGLLRSSSIPARYTVNTVEIPIGTIMNWVGNFTDPKAALTFIASGGIPVAAKMSGGQIVAARMEMLAVEAYVSYGPYSGRPSNLNADKIWVPLDPSFKQNTYTEGIDLQAAVPFDAQAFANQVQATATINEVEGYVTGVDSSYVQTTMTDYQMQVQNYINQNMPNATVGDIVGKKEIKEQKLGILPVTLPYKVVTAGVKYSEVPDSLRHRVTFEIHDDSITGNTLFYTISVPEIAGKRLTLSYTSATTTDEQVISNYGGIFNVPAYLVSMVPRIMIEGVIKATGRAIGLGKQQTLDMKFINQNTGMDIVSNAITVGSCYGIGLNPNKVSAELIQNHRAKLEAVKSTASDMTIYTDDYIGELLYTTAMAYFFELDAITDVMAKRYKIVDLKHVSEAIVSKDITVSFLYGMPTKITDASMMIDVDRLIHSAISQNGDVEKERIFTIVAGQTSSVLEHGIFEQLYHTKGVSTIQVLQLANSQGIPIHAITVSNVANILPMLQVSSEVKLDIQNAAHAGKLVVIPQTNVNFYGWNGTGYIVMDPSSGSAAYMLSTNFAGGGQCISAGGLPVITLTLIASTGDGDSHHCTFYSIEHNVFVDALKAMVLVVAPFAFSGLLFSAALTNSLTIGGLVIALGLTPVGQIALVVFAIILLVAGIYNAYKMYNEYGNTVALQPMNRIFAGGTKYASLV